MARSNDGRTTEDFLAWGRAVVNATASRLEEAIAGAQRGSESHLDGYEALYVHFRDAKVPQPLAVWIYAAREGSANNVSGYRDAIGIGVKRDADEELNEGAWAFRALSPLRWRRHIDSRYEGYRWLRNADELPRDADQAAADIADRVLATLRRAGAID
jgi:hypothetical protein